MAARFIGGGNRRKPPTCRKSLANFITCYIEYTSPWTGFELTTLMMIGTDCTCSCKSNYHTITTTTTPPKNKQSPLSSNHNLKEYILSFTMWQNFPWYLSVIVVCLEMMWMFKQFSVINPNPKPNPNPNPSPYPNPNPNPNPNCYIRMVTKWKVMGHARWLLQYLTSGVRQGRFYPI